MEKNLLDCWPGNGSFEDITTWGIDPLLQLNRMFDDAIENEFDDDAKLLFFMYDQKSKLLNLKTVLERYDYYIHALQARLRDLSPGDPVLKNPKPMVQEKITEKNKRMERFEKEKGLK